MKKITVNGAPCASFSEALGKLAVGAVMIIEGDWTSSGPLKLRAADVTIIGVGAKIQSIHCNYPRVTLKSLEVTGSALGVDGVFITANDCSLYDLDIHDSGLSGLRFYNCQNSKSIRVKSYDNNRNTGSAAGNADGINASGGGNHLFLDCEVWNNSDDGFDMWSSKGNRLERCYSHDNDGLGDANGFKLGAGGGNTLIACISSRNGSDGFDSNGAGNYLENCIADDNNSYGYLDFRVAGNVQHSTYKNCAGTGNDGGLKKYSRPDLVTEINTVPPVVNPPTPPIPPKIVTRLSLEIWDNGNVTGKVV